MAHSNSHVASEKGAAVRRTILDGVVVAYLAFTVLAVAGLEEGVLVARIPMMALIFLGLMVLGGLISLGLNAKGIKTLGWQIYAPSHLRMKSSAELATPIYQTFWGLQMILVVAVTTLVGIKMTEIDIIKLLEEDRFNHAMRLFGELFSPDWSVLPKAIVKVVETIYIAFIATVIAVPIAFVLSFLMARNIMGGSKIGFAVYASLRTIFNVSRSIEPVLWAIIFSIWAVWSFCGDVGVACSLSRIACEAVF
jgi:phosphonate transport system permease protein